MFFTEFIIIFFKVIFCFEIFVKYCHIAVFRHAYESTAYESICLCSNDRDQKRSNTRTFEIHKTELKSDYHFIILYVSPIRACSGPGLTSMLCSFDYCHFNTLTQPQNQMDYLHFPQQLLPLPP